jgi:hypothetical protein
MLSAIKGSVWYVQTLYYAEKNEGLGRYQSNTKWGGGGVVWIGKPQCIMKYNKQLQKKAFHNYNINYRVVTWSEFKKGYVCFKVLNNKN